MQENDKINRYTTQTIIEDNSHGHYQFAAWRRRNSESAAASQTACIKTRLHRLPYILQKQPLLFDPSLLLKPPNTLPKAVIESHRRYF